MILSLENMKFWFLLVLHKIRLFKQSQGCYCFSLKKVTLAIKKWTENVYRCFSKENAQMSNRHMKRCSASLIIREMQIKTTIRYHLTLVRMSIIKMSTNDKCWRGCRENGTLLHCWWEYELVQLLWRTVWRFLKKPKATIWSSSPTPGNISWRNYNLKRHMHPYVHSSTIHNSQDMEAT